jgi:hypothetical protein
MDSEQIIPDRIRRAFVRLDALRKNLPERFYISEEYVNEYHEALKHLSDLGFDAAEFQIPDRWLERRVLSSGSYRGTTYTKHRQIERTQFLTKLDAAIGYFTSPARRAEGDEGKKSEAIGFSGPKKS